MITFELLSRVGEALHGALWHKRLAADLDISDRAFRVWSKGRSPIPDGIAQELLELLEERDAEIAELRAELTVALYGRPDDHGDAAQEADR
jgi:hypothetical protein